MSSDVQVRPAPERKKTSKRRWAARIILLLIIVALAIFVSLYSFVVG